MRSTSGQPTRPNCPRERWQAAACPSLSNKLTIHTSLTLPPYSPELNPIENIWQFLRQNLLANRVFDSYETIVAACCDAWNALIATPERLASITSRNWAQVSG